MDEVEKAEGSLFLSMGVTSSAVLRAHVNDEPKLRDVPPSLTESEGCRADRHSDPAPIRTFEAAGIFVRL